MIETLPSLVGKEWKESVRTSRLLIWVAVSLFFGILSPLTAYFMPDILSYVGASQNIMISIGTITYHDAMEQYLKNFTQIGTIVIIVVSMGCVAGEKHDGSMQFLLSHPVSRTAILLAKVGALKLTIAIGQLVGMFCMAGYCLYLFPDFPLVPFIFSNLFLFIYFLTFAVITVSFSAMVNKPVLAAVGSLATWLILSVITLSDRVGSFSIARVNDQMMQALEGFPINWKPTLGALIVVVVFSVFGVMVFSRWEPED
jgi:ABC-2 type transport system permease protein